MKKENGWALLPIAVFLVIYLGLGILFEYILKIPMGFYKISVIGALLAALLCACLQNRKLNMDGKLKIMGEGVGDPNIITMILIFLMSGMFVGIVGRSGADSVAYFMLSIIPPRFAVVMLFIIACFVSTAMGTSVGTITMVAPIALSVAKASGFDPALCVGTIIGGAMFGDNLSFISDTTIAACNGQGCQMKDKFRTNFGIAFPAAIITLVIIAISTVGNDCADLAIGEYNLIQIIPYVLVLAGGIIGINVFVVLLVGIVSGTVIMIATGALSLIDIPESLGNGISGMYETILVAVLVSAICGLVREYGGFEALLNAIRRMFHSNKGGQLGMGLLVGLMDIATANNTVAIVMANPIAKEMASEYGISPRKTASLLDTFSCIFQGIIPYGAQLLVAIAATEAAGMGMSAFNIMPYLWYPFCLLLTSLVAIFLIPAKNKKV